MLALYGVCFAEGMMSHLADFVTGGWLPYHHGLLAFHVFWTLLIVLDPAVIGLLLLGWRRSGLVAALAIMVADVGANQYAFWALGMHFERA